MVLQKIVALCLFIWLLTSACAGTQQKTDTAIPPPQTLKERATAYWHHRAKGQLDKAYLLETPALRKKVGIVDYIKATSGGHIIMASHVKSITIDGAYAKVTLQIRHGLMGIYTGKKGITRNMVDTWELVDGQWYHYLGTHKKGSEPPASRTTP